MEQQQAQTRRIVQLAPWKLQKQTQPIKRFQQTQWNTTTTVPQQINIPEGYALVRIPNQMKYLPRHMEIQEQRAQQNANVLQQWIHER